MSFLTKRNGHVFSETCERDGASTRNFPAGKYPCSEKACPFRFVGGFTLLELIISLAIFAFMTAFLLAKYGTFNQSVILTDLAYDTALAIQNAQASALDVQGATASGAPSTILYNNVYGIHFTAPSNNFIYFVNPANSTSTSSKMFIVSGLGASSNLGIYTMKAGDTVSRICIISACAGGGTSVLALDVSFQRPNPDATIIGTVSGVNATSTYADITISGSDGSTRDVIIRGTGEISVSN
jgi:prepilin-type N-terminal cleavage/methylation domain-containing protein